MKDMALPDQLEELLATDAAALQQHERALVDRLPPLDKGVIVYGAGRLGLITSTGLRKAGVEVLTFADRNPKLWDTKVDGRAVMSVAKALHRHGPDLPIVVSVYTARATRDALRQFGVTVVSAPLLFLRYADIFLPHGAVEHPHYMAEHFAEIRRCWPLWADDESRREYLAQLRYRLALDEQLPPCLPPETTYFPEDLVPLRDDEQFVDVGAFDGDSVRSFLQRRPSAFQRIVAVEADPTNHARLKQFVESLPPNIQSRVRLIQAAAGARRQMMRFDATGTAASTVGSTGTIDVQCVPLDEALAEEAPTYVKMDIEGAEPDALAGARAVIQRHAPVLAVCLYHRQSDLWRIPLLVRGMSNDYAFFLRRYCDDCWEQVLYAIPRARLSSGT